MKDRDMTIIKKMLLYCREIDKTHDFFQHDKDLFCSEEGFVYRNSVTMPILQIGELSKNLSEEFRTTHSDIPWKSIAGMRDIFAHHYGSIDLDMVWNTSKYDIGVLETFCIDVIGQ